MMMMVNFGLLSRVISLIIVTCLVHSCSRVVLIVIVDINLRIKASVSSPELQKCMLGGHGNNL